MKFDLISNRGAVLPLFDNEDFILSNVDGHTNYTAALSSTVIGGMDGDEVTNIQAQPRQIIIDLIINKDKDVETVKRNILRYVKAGKSAGLQWTQNNRTVVIWGKVEAVEMPRWNDDVTMQITLHCEEPFWEDVEEVVQKISEIVNNHYFSSDIYDQLYFEGDGVIMGEYDLTRTKEFYNDGDVATGLDITITALDRVTNPIIYAENGDFFGIGYGNGAKKFVMESGDTVKITTHRGNKTAKINGVDLYSKIKPNSTWLQLSSGYNVFSISSDDTNINNMYFSLSYKQKYI